MSQYENHFNKLITCNLWWGASRNCPEHIRKSLVSKKEVCCLATRLDLETALEKIKKYEEVSNENCDNTSIEFELISISTIEYVSRSSLENLGARIVEDLPQSAENMDV